MTHHTQVIWTLALALLVTSRAEQLTVRKASADGVSDPRRALCNAPLDEGHQLARDEDAAATELPIDRLAEPPGGCPGMDGDGVIDLDDYAAMILCLAGPGHPPIPSQPECIQSCLDAFDMDDDADIDLADLAVFQYLFGDIECVIEGDSYAVVPDHPACCPGLISVGCEEPDATGTCQPCAGAYFCTDCGDGECGPGENECRCPADCTVSCVPEGESHAAVPDAPECCPGLTPLGCDEPDATGMCQPCAGAYFCTDCGDGECSLGENECRCPADCTVSCVPEGESHAVVPDAPECCPGLIPLGCDEPDATGTCQPCDGAYFCTDCGDGECGPGENECRCPADCTVSCVPEGESHAAVPDAPECCPGLTPLGCDEPDATGTCQPCAGAYFCTDCGDGECSLGENECRCPADCTVSCVPEGESHAVVPDAPECRPGLIPLGCDEPDATGTCQPCDGAYFCTDCGDGECGLGENECRCPADCTVSCVPEGESHAVVPDAPECCPGLIPLGCDEPDATGTCQPCAGAYFCTDCGDGECSLGENECRCPADCPP